MAQQEVMYSQLMHPSEISKEGNFAPFHQQQPPLETRQPHPSLSLSLERPDEYTDVYLQRFQHGPFNPAPARPFEARPPDAHARSNGVHSIDLEQKPFEHMEQPNYSIYDATSHQTHHGMETGQVGASSEQAHLPIVPASEYRLHHQAAYQQHYPLPSANHEDVIHDAELFMTTLENFLAALGTRLMVPKLRGKEVNLHAFYCEVTTRGGLKQVIRTAQWKEVSEALDMPRCLLSTSFVLRKLYISLLFHYEQVYFFRVVGAFQLIPAPLPAPTLVERTHDVGSLYEAPAEIQSFRKRKSDCIQVFGVDPAASVGTTAIGAINGKFEEGYLVMMVVGTEKLAGILYHAPAGNKAQQFACIPSLVDSSGLNGKVPGMEIQLYGKQSKQYIGKKNSNMPKRSLTAYNIFFKEQCAKFKQLDPEIKGHGKKVIEMWNKLSKKEKAPYIARGNQERVKYLAEYREKKKFQKPKVADGANSVGSDKQAVEENGHSTHDVSHDYHVSLDVDSDLQSGHPQMSNTIDQVYHPYIPECELPGGHTVSEQADDFHEDHGDYPQESLSEEDDDGEDAEVEEAYEEDDDETAYPDSENNYEAQDGGMYQVLDRDGNFLGDTHTLYASEAAAHEPGVPTEDMYRLHAGEVRAHDPGVHSSASIPKQRYYEQDHTNAYVPVIPRPNLEGPQGSVHMAPFEQVIYPYLQQQGCLEASGDHPRPHHYFAHGYSQCRQGLGGEALGLPVAPQDQGSLHRQDKGSSYLPPFQRNPAMESNMHLRQVPSEVAYRERYLYPVHMSYPQVYARPPHPYPVHFPHPPYPMQMNESQGFQYGLSYAAQAHQSQASIPEVSGAGAPSQVYLNQDGGLACHSRDGNSTPVFKDNVHT